MKLRTVIVDDEPLASEGLAKYVEVIDYLELTGIAQNPLELDTMLEKNPVDLILLDIQMPHMTGLDFLRIKNPHSLVIITSAFPNYALEGFQYDVLDYLLKPITFNRFYKAATKAKNHFILKAQSAENLSADEQDYLLIKCENKYERILIPDILFVQAMQNYVSIHTSKGKYLRLLPLKKVEDYLDSQRFIRVHKSYLVATAKIDSVDNGMITIQGHEIAISRNLRDYVMEVVVKNKLLSR